MSWLFNSSSKPSSPPTDPIPEVKAWANNLRSALLTNTKKDEATGLIYGINLGDSANFRKEVDTLVDDLEGSYLKYKKQIEKYKRIEEMNKKLVPHFKSSMTFNLDVSNLLQSYVVLFKTLQTQIKKFSEIVGKEDEQLTNIQYLEEITQQKIGKLKEQFDQQAMILNTFYEESDLKEKDIMKTHLKDVTTGNKEIMELATKFTAPPAPAQPAGGGKGSKKGKALKRKTK